jgi:hypothetical protein
MLAILRQLNAAFDATASGERHHDLQRDNGLR